MGALKPKHKIPSLLPHYEYQAPVVRKVDSASAIGFANAYSLDSDLSSG